MENTVVLVIALANDMFFDTDNEDEENAIPKNENYAENVVPRYSDQQFKAHFRIMPDTFEDLLYKMHNVEIETPSNNTGRPQLDLEKQVMVSIWYMANLESFRSVADRFGISKSTCWSILYRTCRILLKVNAKYKIIWWPNRLRALKIIEAFKKINGFPGIIGAIDGTHVQITKPKEHPNSYCNRKNYHSVLLQGVCDHEKLFLDVYAGEPGSIHDARLFRKSDLYRRILNQSIEFPNDSHMIGDLAYTLSTTMMVGLKNYGNLTVRQKNYNFKLSQCRAIIENAYAYLKGRFRRLKLLETVKSDLIVLLIVSACIMHNICILSGDLPEEIVDIEHELENERRENFVNQNAEENEEQNAAVTKRNNIINSLNIDERYRL